MGDMSSLDLRFNELSLIFNVSSRPIECLRLLNVDRFVDRARVVLSPAPAVAVKTMKTFYPVNAHVHDDENAAFSC